MMLGRLDPSLIARWWLRTDRWLLTAILLLMAIGAVLIVAASPPVAARINVESFHFVKRHLVFLAAAILVMLVVSALAERHAFMASVGVFVGSLAMLGLVLLIGPEIKGAKRWINVGPISLQPSEFLKPSFAVVSAWAIAAARGAGGRTAILAPVMLYAISVGLIIVQPDFGQAVVLTGIWLTQIFLAGIPLGLIVAIAMAGVAALIGSYFAFSHVASRVNRFLDPQSGDTFQIDKSLEAISSGRLFGKGPGEGLVKFSIPDAHADFVFAVAAEEFGLILCLLIVGLLMMIALRACRHALQSDSLLILLAIAGIVAQFALQSLINIGSALHLIPTKGMTLPFLSYGGSSLLALGFAVGVLLRLTQPWTDMSDERGRRR